MNFAGVARSSALSKKRRKGSKRGVNHGKKWMRMPAAHPLHCDCQQASSYVARCVAARAKAAPARPAAALDRARDPHRITVAVPIPSFLFFSKFN